MDKINLTCQGCSNHCPLQVTVEEGKVEEVQGNCCHRGIVSANTKGNWVKRKSRIKESVESLIKWVFEKTVNKSWQNRWETKFLDKM